MAGQQNPQQGSKASQQTQQTHSTQQGTQGRQPSVRLEKKGQGAAAQARAQPKPHAQGQPVLDFVLQDNGDDTCTVFGTDAAGNTSDISAVATITVQSDDPSVLTVDQPTGMQFAMHATGKLSTPGTPVNVTVTATWNDPNAGIGPFTFTLPVDVVQGVTTGVVIKPGTPTMR